MTSLPWVSFLATPRSCRVTDSGIRAEQNAGCGRHRASPGQKKCFVFFHFENTQVSVPKRNLKMNFSMLNKRWRYSNVSEEIYSCWSTSTSFKTSFLFLFHLLVFFMKATCVYIFPKFSQGLSWLNRGCRPAGRSYCPLGDAHLFQEFSQVVIAE